MATIGNSGFMNTKAGPLTYGQITGITVGILLGLLILTCIGGSLLGWMFAAILLFFIPHLFGAGPKLKITYGLVFIAAALVLRGAVINPYVLDHMEDTSTGEGGHFNSVSIEFDNKTSELVINTKWNPTDDDTKHHIARVYICTVSVLVFGGVYLNKTIDNSPYETIESDGKPVRYAIDNSNLYYVIVREYTNLNSDGTKNVNSDGNPVWTLISSCDSNALYTGAFLNDGSYICWYGAAHGIAYTMVIFYFITLASWFLRSRLTKTRKKMEDQGRLYPQGYGRCSFCGSIVLPGEIKCRKCGAYIDRPESMKRRKCDYFQCTNCGVEVPADATVCPKCGVKFDGTETEIKHADGTVDVSSENIKCPFCGTEIPKNAVYCPKCLKKLKK